MDFLVDWFNSWNLGGKLSVVWFFVFIGLLILTCMQFVKYLSIISNKSKVNSVFLGVFFVASITSFPELLTEILQASYGKPENGISDDLGSNIFAVFLIAIACLIFYKSNFLKEVKKFTKISIVVTLLLTSLFVFLLWLGKDVRIGKENVFMIGLIPLSFFLFWIFWTVLSYRRGDSDAEIKIKTKGDISLKKAWLMFYVWAICLIVLAIMLNIVVLSAQVAFSLNSNLIGGLLLAVITSMPEILVFILLLRKKLLTGAMMTLIGSAIFNLGISFFGDLFYNKDATFNVAAVQRVWVLGVVAISLYFLLIIQLFIAKKYKNTIVRLIVPSIIFCTYIFSMIYLAI